MLLTPSPVTKCHTFSDPSPLERDVLYGRPHSPCFRSVQHRTPYLRLDHSLLQVFRRHLSRSLFFLFLHDTLHHLWSYCLGNRIFQLVPIPFHLFWSLLLWLRSLERTDLRVRRMRMTQWTLLKPSLKLICSQRLTLVSCLWDALVAVWPRYSPIEPSNYCRPGLTPEPLN